MTTNKPRAKTTPGPKHLDIRQHGADDKNDRQLAQPFQLLVEAEDSTRHVSRGGARIRRLFLGAGRRFRDIGRWRHVTLLTLDAPHGKPCGEYGEEAVGVQEQRDPVRERDEAEREELVQSNRLAMDAAQVEHEFPDPCAAECTNAESRDHGPREVDRQPAPAERPELVRTHEPEPQHDERERRPVVQACFCRQTEADGFGIVFVLDLHIRRKHRIGRREQRAEQHGGPEGQPERQPRTRRSLPSVSAIATVASRIATRQRRSEAGSRSFRPAVNSEMMTAISVSRSSADVSSSASTWRRPTPHGPSNAPAAR